MNTITKDMVIGDLLAIDENFAAILMASGMHCVGSRLLRERHWKKLLLFTE